MKTKAVAASLGLNRSKMRYLAVLYSVCAGTLLLPQGGSAQSLFGLESPPLGSDIMFWRLQAPLATGPGEPMQKVIESQNELNKFWGKLYSTHIYENYRSAPKAPDIDFVKEIVVVAALGSKSSGGYSITIERIVNGQGRTEVQLSSESPGPGCIVTTSFTAPVSIIKMERPAKPIVFMRRDNVRECK